MVKKWSLLLIVALLIVPLALTACGGDDDKDDKKADDIKLSQTITEETSGITVQYPEGWAAKADSAVVTMANSQAALDADSIPEDGLGVVVMTAPLDGLGATDLATAFTMFTGFMSGESETVKVSEVTDIKVGGADAKRLTISDSKDSSEGLVVGFMSEDGKQIVIVMGACKKGKLGEVEPYALKIAENVKLGTPAG